MKRILIVTFISLLCSCRHNEVEPINKNERRIALQNIGSFVIIGSFLDVENSFLSLESYTKSYFVEPKETIRLLRLQEQWKKTTVAWKHAYPFIFHPLDEDNLTNDIFSIPDINAIELAINQTQVLIDSSYISRAPSNTRGLLAMEYLIFGNTGSSTEDVMNSFNSSNGPRRLAYLEAIIKNLTGPSGSLIYFWSNGGDGYVTEFVNSDGNDSKSSLAILMKQIIRSISRIKTDRIGGLLEWSNHGMHQPNIIEGKFSKYSLRLIEAELKGVESAFSGYSSIDPSAIGINYLLNFVQAKYEDKLLQQEVLDQFKEIYFLIDDINSSFEEDFILEKNKVQTLYDKVNRLEQMVSSEVTKNLYLID